MDRTKTDTGEGERGFLHLSLGLMPALLSSSFRDVSLYICLSQPPGKKNDSIFWGKGVGEDNLVNICHSIACQDYFSWFVWLGRCPLSPSVLHVHPFWSFALCRRGHSTQVERGAGNWANWKYVLFFPSGQGYLTGIHWLPEVHDLWNSLPSFVYALVHFLGERARFFHQIFRRDL